MISRHAKRLLKLRVDEIEVKARISNDTDGQGEVSARALLCFCRGVLCFNVVLLRTRIAYRTSSLLTKYQVLFKQ